MPVYEYECTACGPFSALRAMADFAAPGTCPDCGVDAPRAFLSAPALALMDASSRRGHAVNERAAHEPRRAGGKHAPGCGCCGGVSRTRGTGGAKSFPGARPWMISH